VGLVPTITFVTGACLFGVSLPVSAIEQTCASVKYDAPSGPANTIQFVFDKPYVCGQYANGDWWISADTSGYVQIVSMLPAARDGLNGFEVNPSSRSKQGFDRRVAAYDVSLQPSLPMRLSGDASVIKAVSSAAGKPNCLPCLQFAAVLTVLAKPVPATSAMFRPGYYGKRKSLYSVDPIWKKSLPRLSVSCCSVEKELSFNALAKRYAGVQLDHLDGWVGRSLHPIDNMPDYGASIARDSSTAILRMLMDDFDPAKPAHRAALIGYLQMSIDLLSMAENGVRWGPDGGHGNGRKLPMLFGGYLLQEDRFYKAMNQSVFSEDEQVYFSPVANKSLYGRKCADAEYWMQQRLDKGPKDCRDPYGYIDGGGQDIGAGYQACCTAMPWKYTALAVRLLGLERKWNSDAFLQYADRWVNHGAWASPDPCAGYNGSPAGHGSQYGPTTSGRCIQGAGRYLDKHGSSKDTGYYGSKFGDQLWRWYESRKN
jgi:hypothetical protein